jgi:hypothetical protein
VKIRIERYGDAMLPERELKNSSSAAVDIPASPTRTHLNPKYRNLPQRRVGHIGRARI